MASSSTDEQVSEITTPLLGSGIPHSPEVPNTVNSLTIHPIRSKTIDGITEDNQCAQNYTKSQQLSRNIDEWLISIENPNEGTTKKPLLERVPSLLRGIKSNKKCFKPLIVSIGPYHHNKPKLRAFETWKVEYAKQFVHHYCVDQVSKKKLIAEVVKVVDNARECYEESSTEKYDNEYFIKMMFLDGCFVLHFMRMFTGTASCDMKNSDVNFVLRDLFLLENQIPLLVLKVLMKFISESEKTNLIQNFLNELRNGIFLNKLCTMSPPETSWLKLDDKPHLLDLMREYLKGPCVKRESSSDHSNPFRSVVELRSAGIHFRAIEAHHVTDVRFKSSLICGSTLMLPRMVVDDSTKPLFLNLVAYEMSPSGPKDLQISSYIGLMDSLIDHADDVKELRKQRILLNYLGSDEQVAQLFNEIADGFVFDPSAYANIQCMIEHQCENKIQVWIAEWMHNHFSSPWTVLALLGALLVLALTIVQTCLAISKRLA